MARRVGSSLISRNPPWLRPWTVPCSTLWVFPRCLALKNPPAVTLGTLENWEFVAWRGPRWNWKVSVSAKNMETNKGSSVLPLMETNKIFPLPPLVVPSTGAVLPPVLKNFSSSWADRAES
ncbi:hypothetical protein TNCV_4137241 [Trichonephila clavipes]|nr:hypothetical protein TNCV_4137241 [Trichonephila clavipes]